MSADFAIRTMTAPDGPAVLAIYQAGMDTGHATFQAEAPDWAAFDAGHLKAPRLVAVETAAGAEKNGAVLGWATASPVSARAVYAGVAEESIYIAASARGRGVGRALLAAFVNASEAEGLWTLQAGIFPENTGSIAVHEAAGFRVVGMRKAIGKMGHGPMAGQWRDVALLERRSRAVGAN